MQTKLKKTGIILAFSFIYGILLGIGSVSAFHLLDNALVSVSFGESATKMYPRFTVFCLAVGFAALALLITVAWLNVKKSKNLGITKLMCVCEIILSVVLAIPSFIGFNALFEYLQKIF